MEYDEAQNDHQGFQNARKMRNDFEVLRESLSSNGEDYKATKNDIANLLIASTIQITQLHDQIDKLKKAIVGYETDVIPKLQFILDGAKTDEEAASLANEKFIIEDNK